MAMKHAMPRTHTGIHREGEETDRGKHRMPKKHIRRTREIQRNPGKHSGIKYKDLVKHSYNKNTRYLHGEEQRCTQSPRKTHKSTYGNLGKHTVTHP